MESFMSPEHIIESSGFDLHGPLKVADFGSGAGYFTIPVAKKISREGTIYAIDVQEPPLENLRKRARDLHIQNIQTLRRDLEASSGSGLKEASVDRIIIANILFQAPDKEQLLSEATRILKRGGKILIIEWDPDTQRGLGPRTEDRLSKETLTQMLLEHKYMIEKETKVSSDHYSIVASKS